MPATYERYLDQPLQDGTTRRPGYEAFAAKVEQMRRRTMAAVEQHTRGSPVTSTKTDREMS